MDWTPGHFFVSNSKEREEETSERFMTDKVNRLTLCASHDICPLHQVPLPPWPRRHRLASSDHPLIWQLILAIVRLLWDTRSRCRPPIAREDCKSHSAIAQTSPHLVILLAFCRVFLYTLVYGTVRKSREVFGPRGPI